MASSSDIEAEIRRKISEPESKAEIARQAKAFADEGVAYAQSIAPVGGEGDPHAGAFRDSIHAATGEPVDGLPTYQIRSDDPEANIIEYGSVNSPEHATFAKTAEYLQRRVSGQ